MTAGDPPRVAAGRAYAQFPRSSELPSQSPLFWVQQKDRYLRQLMIRDIEAMTQRKLVVYFSDHYAGEASSIDGSDVANFYEMLSDVEGQPVDLLLHTPGGQTDATEAVVSLLQAMVPGFRVVVPHMAKSNGTMLCLASQEILMGAASELGPIDPHLRGIPATTLIRPEVAAENFVLHMAAQNALQQTQALATKLLADGMMKDREDEIKDTVQKLSSRDSYFSHGSAIDHIEADRLGLRVTYSKSDDPLWSRFWLLFCMYRHDLNVSAQVKAFESASRSRTTRPA